MSQLHVLKHAIFDFTTVKLSIVSNGGTNKTYKETMFMFAYETAFVRTVQTFLWKILRY